MFQNRIIELCRQSHRIKVEKVGTQNFWLPALAVSSIYIIQDMRAIFHPFSSYSKKKYSHLFYLGSMTLLSPFALYLRYLYLKSRWFSSFLKIHQIQSNNFRCPLPLEKCFLLKCFNYFYNAADDDVTISIQTVRLSLLTFPLPKSVFVILSRFRKFRLARTRYN